MITMRIAAAINLVGILACSGAVSAQGYPNKSLRILAPEAGGGGDFAARLMLPGLSASLGQQVIVDNRGSASGIIAAQTVAKAAPDGYTLLFYGSAIWLLPFLQSNVPFDPLRDFLPITMAASAPSLLVVHPSVAARSVPELIALAKSKPGVLNYATGAIGGAPHLGAELLIAMAGIKLMRIDFKGTAVALTALLGGDVHVMFPTAPLVASHLKSGKLRALAVTSLKPSALAPELPTVASFLPGFDSGQKYALFAPARTPATIINRLNQEVVRVLSLPEVKEKFFNVGTEVVASSPQELGAMVKSEMARMGKVIKDAGISAN